MAVFSLDHIAPVAMLAPPQARRSGQAGSDPGRAVNTDSNACRAGEVERNVRPNDFLWRQLPRASASCADLRDTAFSPSNVVATANQKSGQSRQRPRKAGGRTNPSVTDDMRPDQRPRGRFNASHPFKQQPRSPQNNQTFDSNGPSIKIRGSAYQIFERYLTLAREATASVDRIAAENFYQHAEHYFRINNTRRQGNQQETTPRPTTPADVEMNSSGADSREVDADRFQAQWDGDDSVSSESSTH